jgi:Undecaprenyl-phosphate glucose phosphotransferase
LSLPAFSIRQQFSSTVANVRQGADRVDPTSCSRAGVERGSPGIDRVGAVRRISLQDYAAFFVLADVLAIVGVGIALSYLLSAINPQIYPAPGWEAPALIIASALHFLAAGALRTYGSRTILDRRGAVRRLTLTLLTTLALFLVFTAATKTMQDYSRLWFFSWAFVSWLVIVTVRRVILAYAHRSLRNGACVNTSLSIGIFCDPLSPREIARKTGGMTRVVLTQRLNYLEELASLSDEIVRNQFDQVHISTRWEDAPNVLKNLDPLSHISAEVVVLPHDPRVKADAMEVGRLGERLSLCAIERPIHGWDLWLKRNEDIVIAASALALLSPIMLLIALLIRLESAGPILFRQKRAGFNGSVFELLKFRSMYHDKADSDALRQTSRNDPRVTRVGRIIRRTSFDELPQLINVLQGTMSIVGPRPHALQTRAEGERLDELVECYAARHRVKPGITGWAQVHGLRGELDRIDKLRSRVDHDMYYIDNWSIWLDIKIILRTLLLIVHDRHAY